MVLYKQLADEKVMPGALERINALCNVLVGGWRRKRRDRNAMAEGEKGDGGCFVWCFSSLCACMSAIGGVARAEREPSCARAADGMALLSGVRLARPLL